MHSHGKSSTGADSTLRAVFDLFLGQAPDWYKLTIIAFLVLNPVILFLAGPFIAGWIILLQFIFTLALALKCYPLQPGGLLAIEAVVIGLTSAASVYHETEVNFPILLLLMFMVAGIYFLRELLIYIFSKLFLKVRSKSALALLFCAASALMSAFLDALTVMAVIITVATGLYGVYHKVASEADGEDEALHDSRRQDFAQFRGFLRSIVMHSAIGTALGGVATMVGEPQNLLIAKFADWDFGMFIAHVAPVSLPVFIVGLMTCYALERTRLFGYGERLPDSVRDAIDRHDQEMARAHDKRTTVRLWAQGIAALLLIAGLAFHVAEVGLIGLSIIVLATAFCGVIEEKRLGHAFEEALPFTGLLVTFFAIVAVIHEQNLFKPVIDFVLAHDGREQLVLMYIANGVLSAISDNVFVATVYISSVKEAFDAGVIDKTQFDLLAVAINVGTNIPSVATPNGQAAFLFLLTSALAPLIRLGYGKMLWMAVPYTLTMSISGLAAVYFFL